MEDRWIENEEHKLPSLLTKPTYTRAPLHATLITMYPEYETGKRIVISWIKSLSTVLYPTKPKHCLDPAWLVMIIMRPENIQRLDGSSLSKYSLESIMHTPGSISKVTPHLAI